MMIKILNQVEDALDFVMQYKDDEKKCYPGVTFDRPQLKSKLKKAIDHPNDFVLGIVENEQLQGIFVFCHEPDDLYLEMTMGFASDKEKWQILMKFLHEHYRGYELYVILASTNEILKKVLINEHGTFMEEQIEMRLEDPHFKETEVEIKQIEEKDIEAYCTMHTQDGWWNAQRILERQDLFSVYIAHVGHEFAGYADIHSKEDVHHVFDILVKAEFRGTGIGRAIMQKVIEESPKGLSLEVDSENLIAYGLYKSLGFKDGIRKNTVMIKL